MLTPEVKQELEEIAMEIMEEAGIELVELTVSRKGNSYTIDILADRAGGGITMEECGRVNRKIVDTFEQDRILDMDFSVSVASPGLDRPLKSQKDFSRVLGRQVKFYLSEPIDNRRELDGLIQEVSPQDVTIAGKSKAWLIPLNKINKAVQIIDIV